MSIWQESVFSRYNWRNKYKRDLILRSSRWLQKHSELSKLLFQGFGSFLPVTPETVSPLREFSIKRRGRVDSCEPWGKLPLIDIITHVSHWFV